METTPDFASLLDDLFGEPAEPESAGRQPFPSFDYLAVAEELHSGRILVSEDEVAAEYREAADPVQEGLAALFGDAEDDPNHSPPAVDPAVIAGELALAGRDAADLARLRRDFAFRNHPDRVPPALRAGAVRRMQIANSLIDEALHRLRKG